MLFFESYFVAFTFSVVDYAADHVIYVEMLESLVPDGDDTCPILFMKNANESDCRLRN